MHTTIRVTLTVAIPQQHLHAPGGHVGLCHHLLAQCSPKVLVRERRERRGTRAVVRELGRAADGSDEGERLRQRRVERKVLRGGARKRALQDDSPHALRVDAVRDDLRSNEPEVM